MSKEDPLDELMIDSPKEEIKVKSGTWFFYKIDIKLLEWLNNWGDFEENKETLDNKYITSNGNPNHVTDYGRGYHDAISDVWKKIGIDYRSFDKRTATGFSKRLSDKEEKVTHGD